MFQGYLFLCQSKAINSCINNRCFSCSENQVDVTKDIQIGALVFLLNNESDTLIGPFTASNELETGLEPGTWKSRIDTNSFSGNIVVSWQSLHEIKNASKKISFLKNIDDCKLTHYQIQELLEVLEKSPQYTESI